ncbi:MAG: AAA family ATPase, partial [Actinomycetota bacterium]|nr:AAA family ATPase [Actinomycetota bacterium]
MLAELRVRDLGVIAHLELVLGPGMTALTGETGAGKTMLVEAIELLVGGRPDGVLVRSGAEEAWVEGRFVAGDEEVVLARAVPASGRTRAYVDGRMAPVSALAEIGASLVDLHGQHAHQSLLAGPVQRAALDAFGGVDLGPLLAARQRLRQIDAELVALGGDQVARAREADFLRHQLAELEAAAVGGPEEDAELEAEEERLADASGHREAAARAHEILTAEGGALDSVGLALVALARRAPLGELQERLRVLSAEVGEVAVELR